jgi:hypothetical protein
VSDGESFRIFIPSKNKFLVGPTRLERAAKKPIENLRPQHLVEALFWTELPPAGALFEEFDAPPARYYILTELRGGGAEIARRVWFERSELRLARIQLFGARGRLQADIFYGEWTAGDGGAAAYPRNIRIVRPHDDYQLGIRVTKLALNEPIDADRFRLEQPPGTELVDLSKPENEAQP